jgi:hypothetical protein
MSSCSAANSGGSSLTTRLLVLSRLIMLDLLGLRN